MGSDGSGRLILYGGEGVDGADLFDTWIWNGQSWTQAQPGTTSPHLFSPLLAFDGSRHQLVLIGATIADPTRGVQPTQTWIWANGAWAELHPANAPNSFSGDSTLADDAATGHLLLYADIPQGYVATHEMWSWDGHDWSRMALPSGPFYQAPRSIVPAPDGGVIGLGGVTLGNLRLGAVYRWSGSGWQTVSVSGTPVSVRAAAYDPVARRTVLVGSTTPDNPDLAPNSDSTFVFDGHQWTATRLPSPLIGRVGAGLAWYAGGCTLLLWGGVEGHGNMFVPHPISYADTWYRQGGSWVVVAD